MADVEIVIKATDQASGVIGGISKSFQDASTKIGSALTGAGKALTLGITAPLVGLGVLAIDAASDLSESMNKVQVVFGDAAAEILAFAETASTSLGMSNQQALEAAGTFGNLFTAMGIGQETSADMSQELLTLAADLASFNNIDPTVALEKLRAGLVGEVEPLRTLGVNLSAAAVEEEALRLGLIAEGEELDAASKAQAAFSLIMQQTINAQGDFARTSDGLANSTRIVKAELSDVTAELGTQLLPIALEIATALRDLRSGFKSLSPEMQNMILIGAGVAAALGPVLIVAGQLITAIGAIGPVISTVLPILGTIAGVLTGPVALAIVAVIAALALLVIAWHNNWGDIQGKTQFVIDALIGIWDWFTSQWALIFDAFSLAFQGDWSGFGEKLREVWDNAWILIKDVVSKAWDWFVEVVPQIVDSVVKFFTETDWGAVGTSIVQGIADGIRAGIAWVTEAAKAVAKAALDAAKGFLGIESPSKLFYDIGQAIGEGLAIGIRDSTDDVMDAMLDIAGKLGSIGGGFANLFKTRRIDPLEEFLKGTEKAVPEMAESLLASLEELGFGGITLEDLLDPAKSSQLGIRYMSFLPLGVRQDWADMLNLMAERNRKQEEFAEQNARLLELEKQQQNLAFLQQQLDLLDLIQEHGLDVEDILGGIQLGLGADEGGLMDAMAKAMQALIAQAEQELGISSPSKIFLEIGRNLMSGMAQGINQGAQMVAGASRGAAQNVTNYFNLTMNTNANQERVVEDFNMMRAMAGA